MGFMNRIKQLLGAIKKLDEIHLSQSNDQKNVKMLLGRAQASANNRIETIQNLAEVEFQIFSQWGDDGIIQFLVNKIDPKGKTFIEFGVENYKESNTRFLLLNNNWSGLVLDGSEEGISYIKNDTVSWTHELFAKQSFITRENINTLLKSEFLARGFDKEVGLLSIDIDGNDYWVWKEIVTINPVIVIVEYNSAFLFEKAITILYDEKFVMDSGSRPYYWGASLKALCMLGEDKGYYFVGCNSNGNNAYFVRKDKIGRLTPMTAEKGYVRGKFRLHFLDNGNPMEWSQIQESLRGQQVMNVESNKVETL